MLWKNWLLNRLSSLVIVAGPRQARFFHGPNVSIQQVDNTKFFGVIIDDLNWSNRISYINSKIANGIGIIWRPRKFFSRSTLINLYYAFTCLYLIYCVEVWGNAMSSHT